MTDEPSYPKLVRTTDQVPSSSNPDTGNMHAGVRYARGKRPYEPPVIETSYPSSSGLLPDVIDEWSGKNLLRSETDDRNQRKLHLVRLKWGVARWREILRRAAVRLGLWNVGTARAD